MELNRRSPLCRLCLCYDDSFACIFEDKASDQYNISSLLVELLELEVSENDGYPKHICLSCRKTVTDFKTFKQNCLKAMITYDMEIRIPENGNIHQRLKGYETDNTTITMGFLKQEKNADDLDAFGNPLTKDECSLSDNELPSSIPGVDCDEIVHEPGVPKVEEDQDTTAEEVFSEEIPNESHGSEEYMCVVKKEQLPADECDDLQCDRPFAIGEEDEEITSPPLTMTSITKTCQDSPFTSVDKNATIIKEINQSQQESSEIIVDLVNKEKCMSPGVLSADSEVNIESNPVEQRSENIKPYKCLECSKEFTRKCVYTRHSRLHKSVTSSSSEHNHESVSTRSADLKQKDVNRETLNINLLQNERKRTLDLERKSRECNGTKPVELFKTPTSSKLDKSNENEIDCIQQGDSLIVSEFQSGGMMTMEERHSFDEAGNVSWNLRNTDVKKGKENEGDGMFSHYNCDHCSKVFNDIRSLNMHLSLHERNVSIEGKEVISSNTEVNKNANDNKGKISHNCGVCERSFKRKYNLKVHMRYHSGEKQYKCDVCHQMFRRKRSRVEHVVHIHENYRCSYCRKLFHVKDKLAEHVQEHLRMHVTEKVFKCHYCDKCFSRRYALSVHERIHTGEKPFICSVCGKSFSDKSNFIVHMRIHMNDKCYTCSYCDKSFAHKSNRRVHERMHTKEKPFRCSHCGKAFSNKSNVKPHERIHQREKEFQCGFCGKRFSKKNTLKEHQKIHLKIKQFECSICKKRFCLKKYLRKHMNVHMK